MAFSRNVQIAEVRSPLAEIVAHESSDLRAAAMTLLEGFSPILDSRPALPVLWQTLESGDDCLRVVVAGAIWIIDGHTTAVVPVFTGLLDSTDQRVRRLAGMNLEAMVYWQGHS